jgi:two-component system response regulator
LLIEDNPNDVELVKIALEEQFVPYKLLIASDGQAGLNMLLNPLNDLPDLVLLDLYLPKVSGMEVLTRLRQNPRTKHLPVVIFSASPSPKDLEISYNLGANAFIQKSLDPEEVKATLKNLDVYWLIKMPA